MLAYFLAIVMAMISLILYFNAFISPKIHRQDDFLWSGLGLFYALTLWICAGKITGAVLLGQLAVVSLVMAFIWENRQMRKLIVANTEGDNILEGFSLLSFILDSFQKISQLTKKKTTVVSQKTSPKDEDKSVEIEEKNPEIKENLVVESKEDTSLSQENTEENVRVAIATEKPLPEDTQTVESVIEEVIKEEIDSDLDEISPISASEKNSDDDFDIDSLGLSESTENVTNDSEKSQGNIFSKFLGFFRKSSPKISDEKESSSSVIETKESEIESDIDPNISATEVETAIENLDLVESSNDDKQELGEIAQEDNLPQYSFKGEETVESVEVEVETEAVDFAGTDGEMETVESVEVEVETEAVDSAGTDGEMETVESVEVEVKTEAVDSVGMDGEMETVDSVEVEVKTEAVDSMVEEVQKVPLDTIIGEDGSIEPLVNTEDDK